MYSMYTVQYCTTFIYAYVQFAVHTINIILETLILFSGKRWMISAGPTFAMEHHAIGNHVLLKSNATCICRQESTSATIRTADQMQVHRALLVVVRKAG